MNGKLARAVFGALSASLLAACPFSLDGGGGGGGELTDFQEGFVFVRRDDRNLYLTDIRDGFQDVLQLTSGGGSKHPSLSPDGARVVFIQTSGSQTEVQVVSTEEGATPDVLFASDTSRRNLRNPVFSPDGMRVVFAYDRGASSYLGRVNVDGTGFQELGTGTLSYSAPAFFPDGQSVVAIAGNPASGYTQLERVNVSTGAAMSLASSLADALEVANRAVVSPDGTKVAFDGRVSSGGSRIFVLDLGSRQVRQLTDYPGDPGVQDTFPTWMSSSEVAFANDLGSDNVYSIAASASKSSGSLVRGTAVEPWYGP